MSGILRASFQRARRTESSSTRASLVSRCAGIRTSGWQSVRPEARREAEERAEFDDIRVEDDPHPTAAAVAVFPIAYMPGISCSVCMRSGRKRRKIA